MPEETPGNAVPPLAADLRRHACVEALAICHRIPLAAEKAGVHPKTLYRYWSEPSFRVEVELQRIQIRENAISSVQDAILEALDSAREDLKSDDPKVRESARNAIFQTGLGMIDRGTLTRKAEKIEEGIEQREAPPA